MKPAREIFHEFVARINAHDVEGLCELMTPGHRFVDGLGGIVEGREAMRAGWTGYFRLVPDYWIRLEHSIESQGVVAGFGTAGGTYSPDRTLRPENAWEVPAAWLSRIDDGLVAEWRVYADNERMRGLMRQESRTEQGRA